MTDANGNATDLLTKPVSRRGALALLGGLGLAGRGLLRWERKLERDRDDQRRVVVHDVRRDDHDDRRLNRGDDHGLHCHPRGDRRSVPG